MFCNKPSFCVSNGCSDTLDAFVEIQAAALASTILAALTSD